MVVATALVAGVLSTGVGVAHAGAQIDGAGSTWAQIAFDQWRSDIARQGFSVNYQGVGAGEGKQFYIEDQVDFATVLGAGVRVWYVVVANGVVYATTSSGRVYAFTTT